MKEKNIIHIVFSISLLFISTFLHGQKYFPITENGKWSIIDNQGQKVLDNTYAFVSKFKNGYASIKKEGVWGVISESNGEEYFPEYQEIKALNVIKENNNAFFAARKENGYGLIDHNNNQFTDFNFSGFEIYGNYFISEKNGIMLDFGHLKRGRISNSNFRKIEFQDYVFVATDQKGKKIIYDTIGNVIYDKDFQQCRKIGNVIEIKNHNQSKLINIRGDILVARAKSIDLIESVGIAGISSKENNEFIIKDLYSNPIVEYESFQAKWLDFYLVKRKNKICILDSNLKSVMEADYTQFNRFKDFLLLGKEDFNFGVFNKDLECIVSENVDYIEETENSDWFLFRQNGKYGILCQTNILIPAKFDLFRIQNNKVSAYSGNTLTIFEGQSNKLKKVEQFDNFVSVKAYSNLPPIRGENLGIDSTALKRERKDWYSQVIKNSNSQKNYIKWGIRDPEDTNHVFVEPSYINIKYHSSRFDLCIRRIGVWKDDVFYKNEFDIYDHKVKGIINEYPLLSLYQYDNFSGESFNFAKGVNNSYILDDTLQVKYDDIGYVDFQQKSKLLRFSTTGDGPVIYSKSTESKWMIPMSEIAPNSSSFLDFINQNQKINRREFKKYLDFISTNNIKFKNAKWGYINYAGEKIIEEDYDYVDQLFSSMAKVYKNGKQGVVNINGEVVPPIYPKTRFLTLENDTIIITADYSSSRGVWIDSLGEKKSFPFDVVTNSKFNDGKHFITYKKDRKYGLLDLKGNIIFPAKSSREPIIKKDYIIIKDRKSGVIDFQGNYLIQPVYPKIVSFKNNRVVYKYKGKYGVGDFEGNEIIPPKFKEITLRENTIVVKDIKNNLIYDYSGKMLNHKKWYNVDYSNELGLWLYNKRGKQYLLDEKTNKKKKIKIGNGNATFSGNHILIELSSKEKNLFRIKNDKLEPLFTKSYTDIIPFDEHTYKIYGKRKFGLANSNGVVLLSTNYRNVEKIFEGVYGGIHKLNFVAVNVSGDTLFSRPCHDFSKCSNGTLMLKDENDVIFLDSNFVNVYNKVYDDAHCISNGIAPVKMDGFWGLMNEKNELLFEPCYKSIKTIGDNLFFAKNKVKYGVYLDSGEELAEPVFERVKKVNDDIVMLIYSGKIGYLYKSGEWMYNPMKR